MIGYFDSIVALAEVEIEMNVKAKLSTDTIFLWIFENVYANRVDGWHTYALYEIETKLVWDEIKEYKRNKNDYAADSHAPDR